MKLRTVAPLLALAVALTACGNQAAQDRPQTTASDGTVSGGKYADATWKTTVVHMYLNVDGGPTTFLYCAGGFRFFSGASSTGDSKYPGGTTITRLPEQDYLCQGDTQNFPKAAR